MKTTLPWARRTVYGPHVLRERWTLFAAYLCGLLDLLVFTLTFGYYTGEFRSWALFCAPWAQEDDQ